MFPDHEVTDDVEKQLNGLHVLWFQLMDEQNLRHVATLLQVVV